MLFEVRRLSLPLLPSSARTLTKAFAGLAETLRNELLLYNISVHLFLPATIFSPGFEHEQSLKPALTKKIEGPDEGKSCDDVAAALIRGEFCRRSSRLTELMFVDE